jgi:SSS family transporter
MKIVAELTLTPILSEGIGYGILFGVGLVMAIVVTLLVRAESKWLGTKKTFEWFYTAGRNVKSGLISASVVSSWTWTATLLQSSSVAYQFGISGPFWYAAGASIQILLFAILAIELKRRAPSSHTFPEIIYHRFKKNAHIVFLFFGLMTNSVVTAMLILGGAAVINSLTGINIYVAAFLMPIGVIIYTFFGGLKATFFAEYLNTAFIFGVILIFVTVIYFTSEEIGGVTGLYNKLTSAASIRPVGGNSGGAFLTIASSGALIFGVINIVGNFGTVFVDQAYWQKAIAGRPKAAVKGFLMGGIAWFAIPFTLATTLGLSAVATGIYLTPEQISSGLVAPSAASHLLGDIGAILLLSILFTAVTSAGSAELVAVSSLVTYDIYRTYVRPSATGRELMNVSRITILGFGMGMGVLASVLLQIGASLQYVYLAMGILIGPAVIPITLSIIWKKTNGKAVIAGALLGLFCGIICWIVTASLMYDKLTISSTGQTIPLLVGNMMSVSISGAICVSWSLLKPEDFNFNIMKQRIIVVDEKIRSIIDRDSDDNLLKSVARFSYKYAISISIILVIIWPLPLYFSGYVFSFDVYLVWVTISIVWAVGGALVVTLQPLIEARSSILRVLTNMFSPNFLRLTLGSKEGTNGPNPAMSSSDKFTLTEMKSLPNKTILVAIDGSLQSLRALNYAIQIFESTPKVKILVLNVIEWANESEDSVDTDLALRMEEKGRKMLGSVLIKNNFQKCERIVKLGDPATKITEVAERNHADMIIMGTKGLGNATEDLGSISGRVVGRTPIPVLLIK